MGEQAQGFRFEAPFLLGRVILSDMAWATNRDPEVLH
eukprot:CAMPEP_0171091094 /NCGR_PEP_ID=MMETSP0766_2-20121228/32236_1 /TAXON_ID=439317 /ORGANISM="Gambierdiscus australes, Strain CAWD 149" /LENGTH=36 /DNA_ID= /DNA_START= /DNA_END= /DNA_ORIENTATION=